MKFTQDYQEIKENQPFSLRSLAREVALTGLSLKTKLLENKAYYNKPRVQFLYIHHVFNDEIENFNNLMNVLSQNHEFISYTEAVNKILSNKIDKPYICISSDDGFKNNLHALEVLNNYNAKGCFFINPDTIGLKDANKIRKFCKDQLHFPPVEFMDWDDIESLLKDGHEIGSHTMGHINIARKESNEILDNLIESFQILEERFGNVEHFAFPFGRFFHFRKEIFDMVFKVGYKSCASAERGCHITNKEIKREDLLIRRDHVICDWNIDHSMYFILKNSKLANFNTNFAPY